MFRGRFRVSRRVFTNKRAPVNTSCLLNNERIRGIFVINSKEICSLLKLDQYIKKFEYTAVDYQNKAFAMIPLLGLSILLPDIIFNSTKNNNKF
jgi:hypothetical protein